MTGNTPATADVERPALAAGDSYVAGSPETKPIDPSAVPLSAALPRSFFEYLRSFGPGLVVALTWLGASDLVNSAVAGADYGYALMWALVASLLARFAFVNIIAKYELCNERGETLTAGLLRIHKAVPVLIFILAVLLSHLFEAYLIRGIGETTHALAFGLGQPWMWSLAWVAATFLIVFLGAFKTLERSFYVFLAMLSLAFIGLALWVGPNPVGILKGALLFEVPPSAGDFKPVLVVISLIGAMAGSLPNLLYPYFIRQKGWNGPQYRRVQTYDLLFGISVMILLNLSVWIVAAEVLHPAGIRVRTLDDLAQLFIMVMGPIGSPLFHAGVLATLATTIIGVATGFGYMCEDIAVKLSRGPEASTPTPDLKRTRTFRWIVIWSLLSPLVWAIPSMPGFVPLTIFVNAACVMTIPLLAGVLWYLTANPRFIGEQYKNKPWENLTMAVLFVLALYATWESASSFLN
ncbi:MAG TPA: Nramp family divalent metal transporter [Steroidobacter sp.]